MPAKLRPVLSLRVFAEEKCFGPGVAELLRLVDEHRSLRAAAAAMGMAYSKAWTIVRRAEAGLGFPLLESQTGGRQGGGAVLTDDARRLLAAYDAFCARVRSYADEAFSEEFSYLDGRI